MNTNNKLFGIVSGIFAILVSIIIFFNISFANSIEVYLLIGSCVLCFCSGIIGLVGSLVIDTNIVLSRTMLIVSAVISFMALNIISGTFFVISIVKSGETGKRIIYKKALLVSIIILAGFVIVAIIFLLQQANTQISNPTQGGGNAISENEENNTVFWVDNDDRYHLDPYCPLLIDENTIVQGTLREAFDDNKTIPCDNCVKDK